MRKITPIISAAITCLVANAATTVTNSWDVDLIRNTPAVWSIWRGDTLTLAANLRVGGITNAVFYWQTPGMGSLWWEKAASYTTNGLVSITWSPDMDSGAETYSFFFKAGDVYRPRGTLIMQASPGASVNSIPLPTPYIDFNLTSYTNAPWLLTELDPAAGAALAGHTSATNPHAITAEGIGALPITGGTVVGRLGSWDGYSSYSTSLSPYAAILKYSEEAGAGITKHHEINLTWEGGIYDDQELIGVRRQWMWPRPPKKEMLLTESDIFGLASKSYVDSSLGGYATTNDVALMAGSVSNAAHDVATSLIGHPYVLQGSTVVPTASYTLSYSGVATAGAAGETLLMPWLATRPSEAGSTGILHIATAPDTYIVDVSGDMHVTPPAPGAMSSPKLYYPVEWRSKRVDETNWIIYAWAPGDPQTYDPLPGAGYYATLSNLVVSTYNRPGYYPGTLTNDTAALPTYTDTVDISRADGRRVATAGGIRDYVDARKVEIAKAAWRYTPAGNVAPSAETVIIDQPLVQQGQIAYLQSGNYHVMSYVGGDWRSTSEGSLWQIGASGRADLSITSEGRMAHIRDFAVDTAAGIATIYASTNWMTGAAGSEPYVEWSPSLDNPQWLAEQNCARTHHADAVNGDYWVFVCPATADQRFFRVIIPGGERRIISTPTHRFESGVEFGGNLYNIITITNGTERYEVLGRRL